MARSVCVRLAFGIVMLMVSHPFLELRAPAFGQDVSKDAEAALKERDRLWERTHELHSAGKLSEAIAAAQAMLVIERKVLPADHANLAASLEWSAELYLERGDFAAAKTACREALEILLKRNGETHWKVADARRALEDVDRRAGMTHEQKQKLGEAARLDHEVVALLRAGKFDDGLSSARRALALRKEVLGERHRDYAFSGASRGQAGLRGVKPCFRFS